jgi:hypothetical protein
LLINGHSTSISNLNATSTTLLAICTALDSTVYTHTFDINYLKQTSTTIFNNLNSLSTNSTLSLSNKTLFSTLAVSTSLTCTGTSAFYGAITNLSTLNVQGKTTLNDCQCTGIITYPVNVWVQDNRSRQRFFFDDAAKTYFKSGGTGPTSLDGFTFRNGTGTDILTIDGLGAVNSSSSLTCGAIYSSNTLSAYSITSRTTINSAGDIVAGSSYFKSGDAAWLRIQGGTSGTAVYNGLSLGSGNGLRVGDFNTIGGGQIYATSNIIRW